MDFNLAISLAKELMIKHNVAHIPLEISRGKNQLGIAYWKRLNGVWNPLKLCLSRYVIELNDEAEVRDTILHEIAHFLVGHGHNHDWVWQSKARSIGCNGQRCASSSYKAPEGRYKSKCDSCDSFHYRHRYTNNLLSNGWRCKCGGNVIWIDTITNTVMTVVLKQCHFDLIQKLGLNPTPSQMSVSPS